MDIWDIGHSTRTEEEFIVLLKEHKIKAVVDVRRFPSSKKSPHFAKAHLETILRENRMDYAWLGDELGGFRKGGYEQWTKTQEFASGIKNLEDTARRKRTVFLCAERDYSRCHRRFIIELLKRKGWTVHHIAPYSKSHNQASTLPLSFR